MFDCSRYRGNPNQWKPVRLHTQSLRKTGFSNCCQSQGIEPLSGGPNNSVDYGEGWYFYWLNRYDATYGKAAQTAFNDIFVKYFRNGSPSVKLQTGADEIAACRSCVRDVDALEPGVGVLNFLHWGPSA